jgi:hypothetical protein
MKMMLSLEPQPAAIPIRYENKILLMGSCFADNMGVRLESCKFQVCYNPTGIVFDPLSVAQHLMDCVQQKKYTPTELITQNGLVHSWMHHSDFSSPTADETLSHIHSGILKAHQQLASAQYLFITLGTAFSYQLQSTNLPVANCHKAPKDWFEKKLLTTTTIEKALKQSLEHVFALNPKLQVVFTVSPVKHIRDGVIENNRSKARLIEAVHSLTEWNHQCSYFPAYELVNDILRDYRFYATDMSHPSEQAIDFVFEFLCDTYLGTETQRLMQEVKQIVSAKNHRPLHANTQMHQTFLKTFLTKTLAVQTKLPMLNWEEELAYFTENTKV